MKKLLIATIAGALLGVLGAKFLFVGSWLSLIPWTIVGLGVGAFSDEMRAALQDGASYGFVLSFVFIATGYAGSAPILERIPFFVLLGLVGAICGLVLGFIGYYVRQIFAPSSDSNG